MSGPITPGAHVFIAYQTDPDPWLVDSIFGDQAAITRECDGMQSVMALSDLSLVTDRSTT